MEAIDWNPQRGFKVTLMLADAAQVAGGKLNVLGAGWTFTGPGPCPFAIAGIIEVPWHLTNTRHTLRLDLIDLDGNAVEIETPDGKQPLWIEHQFEEGRPTGYRPGSAIPHFLAINSSPLPLAPGSHYEWRWMLNGESHEDWRLPLGARPDEGEQKEAA